jgi:hypothetical protein
MRVVAALFSMLMPGCGQFYNREFIKGLTFIIIEHFDNTLGHVNKAIHLDFTGFHREAIAATDFQYMLFYPGFYAYCIWDAWYHAKPGNDKTKTAIPFLVAGFMGTISAIFATSFAWPVVVTSLILIIPMLSGMYVFRKR